MQEQLESTPLIMLIKYPDVINTGCPVDASLQLLTLASQNLFQMMEIHVAKYQCPVCKISHITMQNVTTSKHTLEQ
jgi:hypothetical protein